MAVYDPTTPGEVWYPIPDCPGYQISSDLRIRSFLLRGRRIGGSYGGFCTEWRIKNTYVMKNGYVAFTARVNGRAIPKYLHHIVASLAYGYPLPEGNILHYDDDKMNNFTSNLRIGNQTINLDDARRNGRLRHGERNVNAKLDPEKVREIRRLIQTGMTHRKIAAHFGIAAGLVSLIRNKKAWGYVD